MTKMVRRFLAVLLAGSLILGGPIGVAGASGPGSLKSAPIPPFLDVIGTKYHAAVGYLYELGVVSGTTQTSFEPQATVTRAQMAAFIVRALGKAQEATGFSGRLPFSDVPENHWARGVIGVANSQAIISGFLDGTFKPDDLVTYAQASAMLLRALGQEKTVKGEWPTGPVVRANELGLLKGTDFSLNAPATRGDIALMLAAAVFTVDNPATGKTLSQTVFMRPVSIKIAPAEDYLLQRQVQLAVLGYDWFDRSFEVVPKWDVTAGSATISSTGVLAITGNLPVTVKATVGDKVVTKKFNVIKDFSVTPTDASVVPGGTLQFKAVGETTDGKRLDLSPTWTLVSGNGTLDQKGLLIAKGTGEFSVRATVGDQKVEVRAWALSGIEISPRTGVVAPGESLQFTIRATDGGDVSKLNPQWSIASGSGNIDAQGKFTASGSGPSTIKVQVVTFTDTVTVHYLSRIAITPSVATFSKAESVQFTAVGFTTAGDPIPVSPDWNVVPTLGVLDSRGLFIATTPGTGEVTATFRGVTGRVPVTVSGEAVRVNVTANPVTVPANGKSQVTLTARAVDADGNVAKGGATSILFSLGAANLGTLSSTQVPVVDGVATVTFTPSTVAGNLQVFVSAPGTQLMGGSATITTTAPVITKIALSSYPNPLAADGVSLSTITATLTDSTGAPIPNNTSTTVFVNLATSGAAAGQLLGSTLSIAPGQSSATVSFRSGTGLGTTTIYGNSNYPVDPTMVTTVIVGPATHVKFRPGIQATNADGSSEMTVQVEVRDANGNVRTSDNSSIISLSATSGNTNLTQQSATTTSGVATFKLKSTVAGNYRLKAWSLTSGLGTDEVDAVFSAGPAAKLTLSVEPATSIAADNVSTARLVAKITDAYGNPVPTATNPITFSKVGSATVISGDPIVYAANGSATLTVRATSVVGTDTYSASSSGLQNPSPVTITTRITGVPTRVAVQSINSGLSTSAGSTMTVRVHVLDPLGQLVTGSTGRLVTLNTNSATVVTNSPQRTQSGVATFTLTTTKAETVMVTAASDGLTSDLVGASVTFTPGVIDRVILTATPESIAADGMSRTTITAMPVDAYGNTLSGYQVVTLGSVDSRYAFLSSSTLYTGSSVTLTSTATPGTVTITGTTPSYPVTPLTVKTYVAGAPAKVTIEQPSPVTAGNGLSNQMRIRVRVLDANGNLLTSLNSGTSLTAAGLRISGNSGNTTILSITDTYGLTTHGFQPNGLTSGSASIVNGIATLTYTNTRAETVTITPVAYFNGQSLAAEPATATTLPGPATQIVVEPSARVIPSYSSSSLVLGATISDAWGNPVSTSADSVTFQFSTGEFLSLPNSSTVATVNGRATLSLSSRVHPSGGITTITARSANSGLVGTTSVATDHLPPLPTLYASDNYGIDLTVGSTDLGARVTVVVSPRNSEQKILVYVNGVSVPLYVSASGGPTADTIPAGATTLVAYIFKNDLGTAGYKDIRAVSSTPLGISPMSNSATLTVSP